MRNKGTTKAIKTFVVLLFLTAMALLSCFTIQIQIASAAPNTSELRSQRSDVAKELAAAQEVLDKASDDYNAALTEQQDAQAKLDQTRGEIAQLEESISASRHQLSVRVAEMYRNDEPTMFIEMMLGCTSLSDMIATWNAYAAMNDNDVNNINRSKQLQSELAVKEQQQFEYEEIAEQKRQEAEQIKDNAQATTDELQSKLDGLDSSIKQQVLAEAQCNAAARVDTTTTSGAAAGIPTNGGVVDYAISRLGCPYVWAGSGPNVFDCSGLVMWCYAQCGKSLPHSSESMRYSAKAVIPVSEAQPGDVLYRPGHVGICTQAGGGEYIHAPTTGDVVRYSTWGSWSCALRF